MPCAAAAVFAVTPVPFPRQVKLLLIFMPHANFLTKKPACAAYLKTVFVNAITAKA